MILAALQCGGADALAVLHDRFGREILALAHRVLGDRKDAEDLLHDVLLEAWQRVDQYDPARGSVRAWLLRRARSRAIDRLRALERARRFALARVEEAAVAPPVVRDPSRDPDRTRARAAVARLPAAQRRVIELAYFEGLTRAEIARGSGIPLGTVKSRIAAALASLRTEIGVAGSDREKESS